jgi:Flp pilus assembly protein TadG
MVTSSRARRCRGSAIVEFAFIAPVVLIVVFAQIAGGIGISRYQEVAHLARDCARYASTHGGDYQLDGIDRKTGVPAVTGVSDLRNYLANKSTLLDKSKLEISLAWTAPGGISPANIPLYVDTDPTLVPPGQSVIRNNVIVTLTYQWFPEAFFGGPIELTSTSKMPMSY